MATSDKLPFIYLTYRRYYLHKRLKLYAELKLVAKDRVILVSYRVDPINVLNNKYVAELMKTYGYSVQVVIE